MQRLLLLTTLIFLLLGCKDIFTTSIMESFKKDASEMTLDELIAYISTTPLSEIPAADLALAETLLEATHLTEEDIANNPALVEQYLEETIQLLAINMAQADVEGLISDLIPVEGEEAPDLASLLEDTTRLDNMKEASGYAVDAFLVDPESLTSTELLLGGVGLMADILQDDVKATALEGIDTSDTAALEAASFTAEEIENIQTASAMLSLAESGLGEDSPMAFLIEGLPI